MAIKVLHTESSRSWGGQHMRTLQEMRGMEQHGVETLLACPANSQIGKMARAEDMSVYSIEFTHNLDCLSLVKLYRLIKRNRIDILNCHSSKDMCIGWVAAKLAGIKFIRSQHHPKTQARHRSAFMYRLADHIIPTGSNVKNQLVDDFGLCPQKVTSIPSGQDQNRFSAINYDRCRERDKLKLKKDDISIGTLGFLSQRKGIDDFLSAARRLCARHSNMHFFIVGGGKNLTKVNNYIKDHKLQEHVHALGHMDDPAPYLSALDVFIMASHEEAGPQTLMQAMMMDLPTVASRNVGSVPDLYDDNMLLFEAKDIAGLEKAIEQLATDDDLRKRLAANARRPAVDLFSEETMFKRILAIYDQLLPGERCS